MSKYEIGVNILQVHDFLKLGPQSQRNVVPGRTHRGAHNFAWVKWLVSGKLQGGIYTQPDGGKTSKVGDRVETRNC